MFQFEEKYILKNKMVEITPLEKFHESELFKISNTKEIWEHFTENGFGKENFTTYISNAINNRKKHLEYPFIIKDLRINKIAGMTRIYAIDNNLKNVKIGHTWIGKNFQGTGLNKNCKFLLFEFLFEKMHMERIGFGASSKNIKSIKAMESVGCIQEGKLRSFLPPLSKSSERLDIVLLSILKNEWLTKTKNELQQKLKRYS
ncbi:GNAT family N-acetyltransferase [Tenacibaculum agarivorans]|uniref:GNAT family N-acetyltransferase n=1 Tax=Tenacibaculum agarivorans TaxID=1908389 RepID=UPI00094BC32E|nr:GNAT family protein [Tenacibaculum agarivorans]